MSITIAFSALNALAGFVLYFFVGPFHWFRVGKDTWIRVHKHLGQPEILKYEYDSCGRFTFITTTPLENAEPFSRSGTDFSFIVYLYQYARWYNHLN